MLHAGASYAGDGGGSDGAFDAPISLPDGSAAAPAAAFSADGGTGLYRPGTRKLGLAVDGAAVLLAQKSGTGNADRNFAFGGDTPFLDAGLHTYAFQSSATGLRLTCLASDGTTQQMWITTAASYVSWVVGGSRTLYLQTGSGGTTVIEAPSSGPVKFGTAGSGAGAQLAMATRSSAPGTGDIPAGYGMLVKNTGDSSVKLWVNDGGTMRSVTLS